MIYRKNKKLQGTKKKPVKRPAAPVFLTKKEKDLLILICKDIPYTEIADRLGKTIGSINSHREGLLIKLKVRSRVGLVLWAIRNGIVTIKVKNN